MAALLFTACNKDSDVTTDQNQTDEEQTEDTGGTDDTGDSDSDTGETVDYTYDSETKTYTVYTADGLLAWNKAVQDTLSLNCPLAADIDLENYTYTWQPVGTSSSRYTGIFNGDGKVISNMKSSVGLIDYLDSDGEVKDLTLENVYISGGNYIGAVAGYNYGSVNNCVVSGTISGGSRLGGVVGYNTGDVNYSYWNNNIGNAFGDLSTSQGLSVSFVNDGEWSSVIARMNFYIRLEDWIFYIPEGGNLPALMKTN